MTSWAPAPTPAMTTPREAAATVFGRTMMLVAATAAFFAGGAYVGRDLAPGVGLLAFAGAFVAIIAMQMMRRASPATGVALLFLVGALLGVASAPNLAYYASTDPNVLGQAAGATALTMGALGAAGYGARRDLSAIGRISSWALLALLVLGVVMIFVNIPGGALLYSVLGLVVFAGLTVADFQRLRLTQNIDSAPLLAMSIFLDALNIFQFFLTIFGGRSRD